jgi:hypothetical protein
MFATYHVIGDFEHELESVVEPLGGKLDGLGDTQ